MTLLVRGCDALVRPGDLREHVDLVVEGNAIASLAPAGGATPADATVLEGTGLLALPGLVNAHTHSPENCLRGTAEGHALEVWLARMFGTAGPYDAEAHRVCALAGALEMLLTGTTAVLDHLWMTPPTTACADAVLEAYAEVGIRGAVAPLVYDCDATGELAERHGCDISGARLTELAPPPPAHELVAQLDDLLARWHGAEHGRLQVLGGPCGPQWCTDELLGGLDEVAARHGAGVHIHVLESRLQVHSNRVRFGGVGAVQGLDRLGLLSPRWSLAHGVWLDEEEIALIAERGAVVVHNPAANGRLGSGRAPVPQLLEEGVVVALGADGSASSDNQVVWQQLKLAATIHNDGDRWLGGAEALTMATTGGAAALGLAGRLGTLEPGMLADVVLLDRHDLGTAGVQVLEAGLALSETGRAVRHVLVDGQLVVRDRRPTRVDAGAVLEALGEQRRRRAGARSEPPAATRAAMEKLARLRAAVLDGGR